MKTKINKGIQFMSLILCFTLFLSTSTYAVEVNPDFAREKGQDNMVDVVLDSSEERYIVVSIPEDKVEEYKKQIEADSDFREAEIEAALGSTDINSRALPAGKIIHQSYLKRKKIKKMVEAASGAGSFSNWYAIARNSMTVLEIKKLIKLTKRANIFILSADILAAAITYTLQKQEKWWTQAYIDIILKKIKAVRYTIIENTTEYPKIWRVFERI